jgi:hypothetical protein
VIRSAQCRQYAVEAARLARDANTHAEAHALYGISHAWETMSKHTELCEKARETSVPSRVLNG